MIKKELDDVCLDCETRKLLFSCISYKIAACSFLPEVTDIAKSVNTNRLVMLAMHSSLIAS